MLIIFKSVHLKAEIERNAIRLMRAQPVHVLTRLFDFAVNDEI